MATTFDKASLALIPSGVKESKVYSIKPTDGSGDFTFSRGTDTATRVNSSGLIEKERGNLFTYSNDFSNAAWTKVRSSVSSGATDPFGGSNAWSFLADTSADQQHYVNATISQSGVGTLSIYAKANGYNWLRLRLPSEEAYFNLADGETGSSTTGISASITDAGGGWYRCEVAISDMSSSTSVFIHIAEGDGDIIIGGTPSGTDGLYIYGAQLEQGLVATDYIETTTAAVYEGITDNLPRLDYSGGASCPSLLLEPSRTNVVAQSEYFDGWIKTTNGTGVTPVVIQNDAISPEGVQNASKITFDVAGGTTSSDWSLITLNVSGLTSGASYVSSVYLKGENGGEEVLVRSVGGSYKKHTLTTEWERYDFLETSAGTSYTADIGIRKSVGHTINSSATIYAYGFQSELGSYPTSYIPTYGTSASRSEDSCSKTGITDLIGQTEGTLFIETDFTNTSGTQVLFSAHDGAANKRLEIWSNNDVVNGFIGGSVNIAVGNTTISNGVHKIALAYKSGDSVFYVDGVQIGTSATSFTISALTTLAFKQYTGLLKPTEGTKQTLVFKTRLTNAELAAITTI